MGASFAGTRGCGARAPLPRLAGVDRRARPPAHLSSAQFLLSGSAAFLNLHFCPTSTYGFHGQRRNECLMPKEGRVEERFFPGQCVCFGGDPGRGSET